MKRHLPALLFLWLALLLAGAALLALWAGPGGRSVAASNGNGNGRGQTTMPTAAGAADVLTGTYHLYLPVVANQDFTPPYDMVEFLVGDERLYEVQHSSGSQARHQTQVDTKTFYHTKGTEISAEWEELWYTNEYIYRGTDTSPGNGLYYTLRDPGMYGSVWSPRYWKVGDLFERNPLVTFYKKTNCSVSLTGTQRSWLLFEKYYPQYIFDSNIAIDNVIQLAWLLEPGGEPEERYYYARHYGLVGWWSKNHGMSYISEIHSPGARPDNTREVIPCLDTSAAALTGPVPGPLPFWPGEHRR